MDFETLTIFIDDLISKDASEYNDYVEQILELDKKGTPSNCDYFIHRRIMKSYYYGRIESLKQLKNEFLNYERKP